MALDTCLYRPVWQKLRVSCLKESNPYGGMTTRVGAEDAINRLNNYIGDSVGELPEYTQKLIQDMGITPDLEYAVRIYQVANFLNSTINGFAAQTNNARAGYLPKIEGYYHQLEAKMDHGKVAKYVSHWNWDVVANELREMFSSERFWFSAILNDTKEKIFEKHNDSEEVVHFYNLMMEINQ